MSVSLGYFCAKEDAVFSLQFEILFCLQDDTDNRLMSTIQILTKKFPSVSCRVSVVSQTIVLLFFFLSLMWFISWFQGLQQCGAGGDQP